MTKGLRDQSVFSAFSRWVNKHRDLPSSLLAVTDIDAVFHRYVAYIDNLGVRRLQYLMIVETKTHGAKLPKSQQDTLSILDQLLRTTGWKYQRQENGRFYGGHAQSNRTVRSPLNGRIQLMCFGVHTLIMSNDDPSNSEWMEWDGRRINEAELVKLLRFELNPDTLRPLTPRRHKRQKEDDMFSLVRKGF